MNILSIPGIGLAEDIREINVCSWKNNPHHIETKEEVEQSIQDIDWREELSDIQPDVTFSTCIRYLSKWNSPLLSSVKQTLLEIISDFKGSVQMKTIQLEQSAHKRFTVRDIPCTSQELKPVIRALYEMGFIYLVGYSKENVPTFSYHEWRFDEFVKYLKEKRGSLYAELESVYKKLKLEV